MISSSDIKFYYSGGASNSDGNASLGGAISTSEVSTLVNELFDEVTGIEHTSGESEYRCIFVKNTSAETAYNAYVYISSNSTGVESSVEVGKEASSGSPSQSIANEGTAPTGVSFSTANGIANAISLGDIAAGGSYAFWIKRIITAGSTPQANDTAVFAVSIDTI